MYLDGALAATTAFPLKENRETPDSADFVQRFKLRVSSGAHNLALLCCALGLIKGEWMIGYQNMAEERKVIWSKVSWNNKAISNWKILPGLYGEKSRAYSDSADSLKWKHILGKMKGKSLGWWQTTFKHPGKAGALAIDLKGMNKGMVWLNGNCLGRYWLIPAKKSEQDWKGVIVEENIGEPTQRFYHLPEEWLKEKNLLVLFEEIGGEPSSVQLMRPSP